MPARSASRSKSPARAPPAADMPVEESLAMATLVAVAAFVASKAAGGVSIGGVKDSLLSLLDSNNDGAHITLPVRLSALPALTPDIVCQPHA